MLAAVRHTKIRNASRSRWVDPARVLWRPRGVDWHSVTARGEGHFGVRYFSPKAEVPFCGHATIASAAAASGGYLRELGLVALPATVTVHQGHDMGRPSLLTIEISARAGTGIAVTGAAVALS